MKTLSVLLAFGLLIGAHFLAQRLREPLLPGGIRLPKPVTTPSVAPAHKNAQPPAVFSI